MLLRDYQLRALDDVRASFRAGNRRVMLQLPTGGGKTLTGASMIAGALSRGGRALFVAHRLELIDQSVSTFARLGITSLGVIRAGDRRRDPSQPVQVASIQTLSRRQTVVDGVTLVLIDEAHRASSESYVKSLFDAYPQARFVGLSATPARQNGKPLGKYFDAMVHGPTYSELIAQGHLVAPLVYSTPLLPDLASVRTVAGDYNAEDLDAAVNNSALIGNLLTEWQQRADGRRTVVFAVSVAHSQAIVNEFVGAGVRAEHLDGGTPEDERRAILGRLESGETQVVSNVGVLCEGWDQPACKCLVLACPTKSLVRYMQMGGRVLRPWQGVQPIILDHGGCVDRHNVPHADREWSLDGSVASTGVAPVKACAACFAMIGAAYMICPHCGYEFPAPPAQERLPEIDPRLKYVELALRTLDVSGDPEASRFHELATKARERGWRPGAAYHKFIEQFGHEPAHAWTLALKRAYNRDAAWRAQVEQRIGGAE